MTSEEKLAEIGDIDLLLEIRRRGLLKRLDAEFIMEGWRREIGREPPREYYVNRVFRAISEHMFRSYMSSDFLIPGVKEEEQSWTSGQFPSRMKNLRFYVPLNIVVMNPARDSFSTFQKSEISTPPKAEDLIADPLKLGW